MSRRRSSARAACGPCGAPARRPRTCAIAPWPSTRAGSRGTSTRSDRMLLVAEQAALTLNPSSPQLGIDIHEWSAARAAPHLPRAPSRARRRGQDRDVRARRPAVRDAECLCPPGVPSDARTHADRVWLRGLEVSHDRQTNLQHVSVLGAAVRRRAEGCRTTSPACRASASAGSSRRPPRPPGCRRARRATRARATGAAATRRSPGASRPWISCRARSSRRGRRLARSLRRAGARRAGRARGGHGPGGRPSAGAARRPERVRARRGRAAARDRAGPRPAGGGADPGLAPRPGKVPDVPDVRRVHGERLGRLLQRPPVRPQRGPRVHVDAGARGLHPRALPAERAGRRAPRREASRRLDLARPEVGAPPGRVPAQGEGPDLDDRRRRVRRGLHRPPPLGVDRQAPRPDDHRRRRPRRPAQVGTGARRASG
jgi:hypothetical protein